ncbi:hypothetical protein GOQ27_12900 [Clostridium sp. D2Q-11]|uniref:Fluoroquinolone transport system permease protein n=1 Tax=Anaeromonas frigoriresistens TaxID=2683708 RepID=A0A942V1B9_9FIRM|nr:hypothetical protein [Anaeromonas frigoriresistens]MBS4539367.1 hypothetical protein [Anaeromonas frigoriresistens]
MISKTSFKADFKMVVRDPILILFFILPIFIPILIKIALNFVVPLIFRYTGVNLIEYYGYVLMVSILITPLMLGTVSAFLLIDERDSRIQELIKITPVGYFGYISNRLLLPFIGSIMYTILTYLLLDIYNLEFVQLILIAILIGIEGIQIAYLLYNLATDKVQGLTYSKGFGVFTILALADIFNVKWFRIVGGLTPFYWITKLIIDFSLSTVMLAIIIHIIYLIFIFRHK